MDGESHSTVWSKLGSFFSGKSSEDHLEQAIREAREDGELKAEEGSMLLSILSLDELQVQDIMTPRTDIDCLPSGTTILDAAGAIVETGHSRLPVYKDTRDNIIGIVDVNGIQADGKTSSVLNTEPLHEKFKAFNFDVQRVNGNSISQVMEAVDKARTSTEKKPHVILCDTVPGTGLSFLIGNPKSHFISLDAEGWNRAFNELERGKD